MLLMNSTAWRGEISSPDDTTRAALSHYLNKHGENKGAMNYVHLGLAVADSD